MDDLLIVGAAILSAAAVVYGVALISVPAGFIVGGLLGLTAVIGYARAPE